MFTKEESLLLLFQRKNVIEPERDLSSSASDLEFKEQFESMLSSNNPWNQIFALFKIFDILKAYEKKDLKPVDRSLIKGIYMRSIVNYKHLQR